MRPIAGLPSQRCTRRTPLGLRVMYGVWRSGCVGGPLSQAAPASTRAGYVGCLVMLWCMIVCYRRHGLLLQVDSRHTVFVGGRHASDSGLPSQRCIRRTPLGLRVMYGVW